jgi:hypothetical protein
MQSTRLTPIVSLKLAVALSLGISACISEAGEPVATGGTGGTTGGSGGSTAGTGGSTGGTGGTGGAMGGTGGTGGSTGGTGGSTGGTGGTGGATGGTGGGATGGGSGVGGATVGGSSGMGGMDMGGSGGAGAMAGVGPAAGTGGTMGDGGAGAGGQSGGGSAGKGGGAGTMGMAGTGSGECVKGMTLGKEVAMIGESFIAATHQITQQVETRAKAEGSLAQNERYVDNSVSGTTLANNQIPSQYTKAVQSSGTIKYVLMDGGGNDCLINNNGAAALTAARQLFQTMAQNNTQKVVYFFYPDPIGGNFASLKSCLDNLRPDMKELCDGLTSPKCYWIDLRESWNGHPEYTSDGIHPTTAGSKATGDVIWETMKANCVAQ